MKTPKRYLVPADFMADPSVHVWDGKIYIYPSHDWEPEDFVENDNGDHFNMKDYHVFSLEGNDPMTAEVTDHGKVLDVADIPWAGRQLWDCEVARKDGRYYMYFPLKDRNDIFRLGVAISDRPEGPFIPQPDPIKGSYSIDPAILEEDGKYYMYFGGLWGGQLQRYKDNKALENAYLPEGKEDALPGRVVRLSEDMLGFAEDPRPVMILDEATSNVDTRLEYLINHSMSNLTKDRTSLVIAHRLSTVRNSDVIMVLEKGRIVERGDHDELLALGGRYSDLYNEIIELD